MSIHGQLRVLVSQHGEQVLHQSDTLRGVLEDHFREGELTNGETNLLVDAVRLHALDRLVGLLEQGADPQAAVEATGRTLARERSGEERSAMWACAALGYAVGRLDEGLVLAYRASAPDAVPPAAPVLAPPGPAEARTQAVPEPDDPDATEVQGQVRGAGDRPTEVLAPVVATPGDRWPVKPQAPLDQAGARSAPVQAVSRGGRTWAWALAAAVLLVGVVTGYLVWQDRSEPERDAAEGGATVTPGEPREGQWVAVVEAAEKDGPGSRRAAEQAQANREDQGVTAFILDSDEFGSLTPGNWVVYDGPYADADQAAEACFDLEPVVPHCRPRYLGDEPLLSGSEPAWVAFLNTEPPRGDTWADAERQARDLEGQGIATGVLFSADYLDAESTEWLVHAEPLFDSEEEAVRYCDDLAVDDVTCEPQQLR